MSAAYPPPPSWARDLRTVGVTGTNGKTTTATWLWAALQAQADPAGAITTVDSRVGTSIEAPIGDHRDFLDVAARLHRQGGRHLALELTSVALAQGIMGAWPVRVGVFTNLTQDHDDQHPSPEHYLAAKAQLFVHLPADGIAVLNASDPTAALLGEILRPGVVTRTYGAPWRGAVAEVDLELDDPQVGPRQSSARISGPVVEGLTPGPDRRLRVPACGLHFLENGAAALLGAIAMGVPPTVALRSIAEAPRPPGRFEVLGDAPRVVIDYAHTPDALQRTLAAARSITRGKLWVVFGAGGGRSRDKRAPLGRAAATADRVVITNDNPRDENPAHIADEVAEGLVDHADVQVELDRGRAIHLAVSRAQPRDVVVIAGKGHEAEQTIGDQVRAFSDRAAAREALAARARG